MNNRIPLKNNLSKNLTNDNKQENVPQIDKQNLFKLKKQILKIRKKYQINLFISEFLTKKIKILINFQRNLILFSITLSIILQLWLSSYK